jgi:hypothetical protein
VSTSDLTIRALKVRAVDAPLARPLRTASGSVPSSPFLLLDVESEEGPVGRAYVFGYTTLSLLPLAVVHVEIEEQSELGLVADERLGGDRRHARVVGDGVQSGRPAGRGR